jgi:uncharacterized phage protein gp47/JayE
MPGPYGVTSAGFNAPTLLEIKAEIEADWREEFGANVDLDPNSPDGQIIGIMADREMAVWEGMQATYAAQDPDAATGAAQDAVCAITGTQRDAAQKSTVTLTLTGDASTVIADGSEVSVLITEDRFVTLADATLVELTARANSTAYLVGDRRSSSGNSYVCVDDGVSGVGTGPTATSEDLLVDGGVVWKFLGVGTAVADVAAEGKTTGPIAGAARTIRTIETPISGWDGVINLLDAEVGNHVETDDALRMKREAELSAAGSSTVPAITAAVLKVDDVTACVTFRNDGATTDSEGRPPHSVEAVVEGGVDAEIAQAIFENLAAGIRAYGTTTVEVTDSQGLPWDIGFSRPDELEIWVRVDVVVDELTFPVDGADQIAEAILDDEVNYPIGKNVVAARIGSRAFTVPGVLDTSIVYIGLADPPIAATTIDVDVRERARFSALRIDVNVTAGTP